MTTKLTCNLVLLVLLSTGLCYGQLGENDQTKLVRLIQRTTLVVKGTIKSKESRWSTDGKNIMTYLGVQVDETLNGISPNTSVVIEMGGGRVGSSELRVIPSIQYERGERVLLFLFPDKPSHGPYFLVYPGGKYRVENDANGQYEIVYNDTGNNTETEKNRSHPILMDDVRNLIKASK